MPSPDFSKMAVMSLLPYGLENEILQYSEVLANICPEVKKEEITIEKIVSRLDKSDYKKSTIDNLINFYDNNILFSSSLKKYEPEMANLIIKPEFELAFSTKNYQTELGIDVECRLVDAIINSEKNIKNGISFLPSMELYVDVSNTLFNISNNLFKKFISESRSEEHFKTINIKKQKLISLSYLTNTVVDWKNEHVVHYPSLDYLGKEWKPSGGIKVLGFDNSRLKSMSLEKALKRKNMGKLLTALSPSIESLVKIGEEIGKPAKVIVPKRNHRNGISAANINFTNENLVIDLYNSVNCMGHVRPVEVKVIGWDEIKPKKNQDCTELTGDTNFLTMQAYGDELSPIEYKKNESKVRSGTSLTGLGVMVERFMLLF